VLLIFVPTFEGLGRLFFSRRGVPPGGSVLHQDGLFRAQGGEAAGVVGECRVGGMGERSGHRLGNITVCWGGRVCVAPIPVAPDDEGAPCTRSGPARCRRLASVVVWVRSSLVGALWVTSVVVVVQVIRGALSARRRVWVRSGGRGRASPFGRSLGSFLLGICIGGASGRTGAEVIDGEAWWCLCVG
jgi:hypothetical protein